MFQLLGRRRITNTLATTACQSRTTGPPDDKWGLAVQGALQIKNIPTGAGDTINDELSLNFGDGRAGQAAAVMG